MLSEESQRDNNHPSARDDARNVPATFLAAGIEMPHAIADQYAKLLPILGDDLCRQLGLFPIPAGERLSVVIPVFNEVKTLAKVLHQVQSCRVPCEIIIVDDGSTDGTRELISGWRDDPTKIPPPPTGCPAGDLKILLHERNRGKGAAVRTGMAAATGHSLIIQDADLEYDPQDYASLWQPVLEDHADVVYGSRFSRREGPVLAAWHTWMNQFITWLATLRTNRRLSDVETCYKLIRRETLTRVLPSLREDRFGIEIELTLKLARCRDARFFERPIHYQGRSYSEGKKITWRDGLWALWCLCRY